MIPREVTIGRATDCDILYGNDCPYVSNRHALIYFDGKQLVYKDTSTNGTLINKTRIHNRSVVIGTLGDNQRINIDENMTILLAGKYPLRWETLGHYFPIQTKVSLNHIPTRINEISATEQQRYNIEPVPLSEQHFIQSQDIVSIEVELTKFNWGAFFLYPFWGFANGMWWAFLIAIFFSWAIFIPNIVFGIKGSRWAWENKKWRNMNHFISVQESWKKWGIGIFLANVFLSILLWSILMVMAVSI